MSEGRSMPGNHLPIDAERLAALLEGRLDARQRAEALESLDGSDEMRAGFADGLAVTAELEAEDAAARDGVIPLRPASPRSRRAWPVTRVLALAAAVGAMAVAPWLWSRASTPGPVDPARLAVLVQADGLPRGWAERPWPPSRGETDPLTPGARAARLGARLVDLELSVRAGDPASARIAAEVRTLLQGLPASGPVQAVYREVERRAGEPEDALAPLLGRGSAAVSRLAGVEGVEAGAWAEAARLAAAREDARFFRARASRAALARAAAGTGPSAAAAARLRARLREDGPPAWPAVEQDATALLRALGGA